MADDRPNIIVFLADDLDYNDVGFTGETEIQTPQLDALAANGVVFNNGYVTHPYCGPSRAGLLTGRYQARFGMENNVSHAPEDPNMGLPLTEKTFAKRLQEVGYRTGIIGKWHLGSAAHFQPQNRGFDYFYGFLPGGHNYNPDEIDFSGNPYATPLQRDAGLGELNEYLTTALSRDAAKFVVNDAEDKPFLLYLAYNAPHTPLQAPEELIKKYAHIKNPKRQIYAAMVDAMDQGIAMVVDALKESGQLDNTLLFFLSDNGGVYPDSWWPSFNWSDNTPFRHGKVAMLEGGVHVPFIAHWPAKFAKGIKFDGLVSALDIAATSVAISGASDEKGELEGVNLLPYVSGEKQGSPHAALFWRMEEEDPLWAVRTPEAKYLYQTLPGVNLAFYDMLKDPTEQTNLVGKYPAKQTSLAKLWNAWNEKNQNNILHQAGAYKAAMKKVYQELYEERLQQAKERKVYIVE